MINDPPSRDGKVHTLLSCNGCRHPSIFTSLLYSLMSHRTDLGYAGDLMTVLLLAALDRQPRNLKGAVEKAVATLQAMLQATVKAAGQSAFAAERTAKVS
jgi:hypothetical protein